MFRMNNWSNFSYIDVVLLNSVLESRGEDQVVRVNWWLKAGVEDDHGMAVCWVSWKLD